MKMYGRGGYETQTDYRIWPVADGIHSTGNVDGNSLCNSEVVTCITTSRIQWSGMMSDSGSGTDTMTNGTKKRWKKMHSLLRKNRRLTDVSTNLGMLGTLVGGNHLSMKEIENILIQWQRDVYELALEIREDSQGHDTYMRFMTGLTDEDMKNHRANERRKQNAEEDS